MTNSDNSQHAEKKQKIKEVKDRNREAHQGEKGLILVLTGPGKGKSSSGFGMILRAISHEMPSAVIQFIKGAWDTGERRLIEANFSHLCQFHAMGEGFTWDTQDKARDTEMAQKAWAKAKELILDPNIQLVLLDEINIATRYGYLDGAEVARFLVEEKPEMTHVLLTGRNAAPEVLEVADLITEMTATRHPYRAGIKAQKGIEF